MRILNFGSCNLDFVYTLDHIVRPGETETTYDFKIFPGGKGLNQSIALARAGAKVYHAGCIGNDGEMLSDILSGSGVDITYLEKADIKNGHAVIQVSAKGENSIFLYPGSNEKITKAMIDEVLENFEAEDIIILQNEISNVDYIIKKACEKKMCIVFNPSPFDERLKDIDYNMISYLLINEVEAKGISGLSEPEEALTYLEEKYKSMKIVLTLGSKGCIYFDGKEKIYQSAYKVEVKDTTAAGDTFTGYFVSEISKSTDARKALQIASAASAIAVSREGAAPSIPLYEETKEALENFKKRKLNKEESLEDKIKDYIEENIKTADINELAQKFGYTTVYTGVLVKKITGYSFTDFVKRKRCSKAAKMLVETTMPIQQIINEIGYENQSFFRKMFKEKYGETPLKYRKNRE